MVGDVVLLQYEGKCRPAIYRLAVVVGVEVAGDGLVRTVTVEYSLLAELPASERLLYKGITKKRVRVSVQRLVLILPVEEWDQDLHPGGMASGVLAPPNEVLESGVDVKHSSGSYDVVWDSERKMYIRGVRGSQAAVPVGQHGGQPEVLGPHRGGGHGGVVVGDEDPEQSSEDIGDHDLGQLEIVGLGHGQGGGGREQVLGQHAVVSEGSHAQGDCEVRSRDVNRVQGEVSTEFKQSLKSCAVLKSRLKCRDFERNIYEKKSSEYDWSAVNEHYD